MDVSCKHRCHDTRARRRDQARGRPAPPGLHLGGELTLPLGSVTSTFGILAIRRSGKSNAAVVMAEETSKAGVSGLRKAVAAAEVIDGDFQRVRSHAKRLGLIPEHGQTSPPARPA